MQSNDDVTITCPADREALYKALYDVDYIKALLDNVLLLVTNTAKTHGYVREQLHTTADIISAAIHDEINAALYILTNELENNEGR